MDPNTTQPTQPLAPNPVPATPQPTAANPATAPVVPSAPQPVKVTTPTVEQPANNISAQLEAAVKAETTTPTVPAPIIASSAQQLTVPSPEPVPVSAPTVTQTSHLTPAAPGQTDIKQILSEAQADEQPTAKRADPSQGAKVVPQQSPFKTRKKHPILILLLVILLAAGAVYVLKPDITIPIINVKLPKF